VDPSKLVQPAPRIWEEHRSKAASHRIKTPIGQVKRLTVLDPQCDVWSVVQPFPRSRKPSAVRYPLP
jgi:hypothetical protein